MEIEIIGALKCGEERAFRLIYHHYYNNLCYIANCYLNDAYLAESIVQDLIYNLWVNHETIHITSSLKNYLIKSVVNRSINYLKLEYVNKEECCSSEDLHIYGDLWSMDDSPLDNLELKELHDAVSDAIDNLPKETKRVFMLSRFENKKQEEIAEIVGVTLPTVKYHMKNATDKLKEALKAFLMAILIFLLH